MVDTERVTARVKWFNNKNGYGFASTLGDKPRDVFVHHTSLKIDKEQYRYLIQGEYVDLDISPITEANAKHEWQSANVTGVQGGALMCETRQEMRDSSFAHREGASASASDSTSDSTSASATQ
jgi:cold shock CspA family protein